MLLITLPATIISRVKNKKLLKLAEDMLSKLSESDKNEIKKTVDDILIAQNNVKQQASKKLNEIVLKNSKSSKLKTSNYSQHLEINTETVTDDYEKSVKNLVKKIINFFTKNKNGLYSQYDFYSSFVIHDYYDDNESIDNEWLTMFDKMSKDVKNINIQIDKNKFDLSFEDFEEYESCPFDSNGNCEKTLGTTVTLYMNSKYINKVFKPLFDKCKNIK